MCANVHKALLIVANFDLLGHAIRILQCSASCMKGCITGTGETIISIGKIPGMSVLFSQAQG